MGRVLLIRHCQSSGQAADAPLTRLGLEQAEALADFLARRPVARIVSSPFTRALQTIAPFAARSGLPVERDARLAERRLAAESIPNWREIVGRSFAEPELALPGGESARETLARARGALSPLLASAAQGGGACAVVSHGQLISLVLSSIDPGFGFRGWEGLSNPDVHLVEAVEAASEASGGWSFRRVWDGG